MAEARQMRFWEIDFARGIAVLMMIVFHFLYDLNYFAGFSFILGSGFWLIFARVTLIIFLLLVGVSLSLSYDKVKAVLQPKEIFLKYVKRGLRIFCYGLAITAVTFAFFPQSAIWFGVLHCIGLSVVLAIPVLPKKRTALALGALFILAGYFITQFAASFPWLLWLGLMPQGFYTFDYAPLLPWFGVVLLGLFSGKVFYEKRAPGEMPAAGKPVCWLGRHSLLVYLIHQPILAGVLLLALSAYCGTT